MTMGNDMLPLAQDVLSLSFTDDVDIKKMIYLYVVTYCKERPEIALGTIPCILRVLLIFNFRIPNLKIP
jgi:vesicle coat complex subunit